MQIFNVKTLILPHKTVVTLGAFALVCASLFGPAELQAATTGDQHMVTALNSLTATLTGPWMKGAMVVGGVTGAVMSFIKQSPLALVMSIGTGVGAIFYQDWVSHAFSFLI